MQNWKLVNWSDECPDCGSSVEVYTNCPDTNMAYDGDLARCTACHYEGWVVEYGDGRASVNWRDE